MLALLPLAAAAAAAATVTFPQVLLLVAPGEFVLDASLLPRNLTVVSAVCI